jgi:hypothetical protein
MPISLLKKVLFRVEISAVDLLFSLIIKELKECNLVAFI